MLIESRSPAVALCHCCCQRGVGPCSSVAVIPYRADPSHFTLFFAAVMVSAWYGGLGAGLTRHDPFRLFLDYFFIPRYYSLDLNWQAFLRLSVFSGVAAI